jgi:hypothetical protein
VLHRYDLASLESCSPPRVRFRLARGLDNPLSGILPRSRAKRPLERGPVSIESPASPRASFRPAQGHHGTAAKSKANPLHYAPGNHAPALLRQLPWRGHPRHYVTLCGMVSNNPVALPPTLTRPVRRTLEKGQRSPRREDEQLRHVRARTTP